MNDNELSYCELRAKEVVNASDGRRMGRITDMRFSRDTGIISGIVVPFNRRGIFSKNQDVFIPWRCVNKIGEDVILVNLGVGKDGQLTCFPPPPSSPPQHPGHKPPKDCSGDRPYGSDNFDCRRDESPPHPDCDNRCEKCMLFDCAYRWSQMN